MTTEMITGRHIHHRMGADDSLNVTPTEVDITVFPTSDNKSLVTRTPTSAPIKTTDNNNGPFERASNSLHHHHHYPFFYHHPYPLSNSQAPSTNSTNSTNSLVNISSNSSPNGSIIENESDISPGSSMPASPTLSPNINSSTSTLSNLNTSALVRTISNGSTFGPIPNWPLCATQSSASAIADPSNGSSHHHHHHQSSKPQSGTHDVSGHTLIGGSGIITPTSPNVIGFGVAGGTASSASLQTNFSPTILATTAPIQNNVPIKLNLPLIFGENYVLTSRIEASNLYRCLEMNTAEEFWCKVVLSKTYYDFLAPHLRMDGHEGINQVQKIIIGRMHTFILFSPSYGDLHSYVRNKRRLRETEAMPLFRQIVQIVADCHSNGIILRDLKLRKFIFSDKERTQLKLETLEGASLFEDDDTLADKHGCPAYVSPEILFSNSFSGLAADCWGMGVILYTMLVGRYPFHDVNPSSVFCKIRRGTYYIPDSLSKHAKCLIRSLMRMDPEERLSADDALAHQWFQPNCNLNPVFKSFGFHPYYHHFHHRYFHYLNSSHHHYNHYVSNNHHHRYSPPPSAQPPMISISNNNNNNNNGQPSLSSSTSTSTFSMPRNQSVAPVPACCLYSNTLSSSSSSLDQIVPDLNID